MKKREHNQPREHVIKVRVGTEERLALEKQARVEGTTVAHLIRHRALDGAPAPAALALSYAGDSIARRA